MSENIKIADHYIQNQIHALYPRIRDTATRDRGYTTTLPAQSQSTTSSFNRQMLSIERYLLRGTDRLQNQHNSAKLRLPWYRQQAQKFYATRPSRQELGKSGRACFQAQLSLALSSFKEDAKSGGTIQARAG